MATTALITGASTGIGRELALVHAAAGGDCVVVARREDKLRDLQQTIERSYGTAVRVIAMDLVADGAAERLHAAIEAAGIEVDYLVNNAGFGGHGLHHQRELTRELAMIELNITTLTALTRLFLPAMVERGAGRVMNVASTAGFVPGPLQAVYYATKAYVISYTQALANELRGSGVTVTALCPGATRTDFIATAGLEGTLLERMAAPVERVARYGYRAMLAGRTVAVEGLFNQLLIFTRRLTPPRLLAAVVRRLQER